MLHADKKIVLTSFIHTKLFLSSSTIPEERKNKLRLLLSRSNVKFLQVPYSHEDLINIFTKPEDKNDTIETEVAFQKIMEDEISHFLHDAKYWIDKKGLSELTYEDQLGYFFFQAQENKSEQRKSFEDKLVHLLQFQHPSFKLLPLEKNLQWIVDMFKYMRMQTLPEGTRFEGVYVDRDGCLYDNKNMKFNQKIIDIIKEYSSQ